MPLTGHVDRNAIGPSPEIQLPGVVPLTGHVDRNIVGMVSRAKNEGVVPLTGHVDRNILQVEMKQFKMCRAPHGARG